jgi:hypothetical protein
MRVERKSATTSSRAQVTPASAALALLIVVSAGIGAVLARQVLGLRGELRAMQNSPLHLDRGAILGIAGRDLRGRTVARVPAGTKRIVAFALIGPDLPTEVAFWTEVEEYAPAGTALIGLCAAPACAARQPHLRARFRTLTAGEAHGVSAVLRANRAGDFLVANDRERILARLRFSGLGPKRVAAEIESAR